MTSRLFVLLEATDAAGHLPAWLDAVRPFAQGVIALDGGSTDDTVALLERDPLVRRVLRRAEPCGLLEAADELDPRWLLWLEAGERVASADVPALTAFLDRDALPGFAYGFRRSGVTGSAFRLFAHRRGQRAGEARLPASIPASHRLETAFRLEPLGGAREATSPVGEALGPAPAGAIDWDAPVLSAIVISRDDEDRIEAAVRAVVEQDCPEPFEAIVVTSGTDRTAEIVRRCFPAVELVVLPRPALPGEARNAGLARARGDYVTFPGSHIVLPQGSLAARIRAHDAGHPLVTGTTLNGTRTWAGWASYFLDHAALLPGRPSGLLDGPPSHCSYVRELLVAAGGFPEDMRAGEDTAVNLDLTARGYRAYRAQDARMVHRSRCRTPAQLVRHHFQRGRAMGRIELGRALAGHLLDPGSRFAFGWRYVPRRLAATTANVRRWGGRLRPVYAWSAPLVVAGALAAWAGLWYEVARAAHARGFRPAALGFAGADVPPDERISGPQERAHDGMVLAALYPPAPRLPAVARALSPLTKPTRRGLTRLAVAAHLRRCASVSIVAVTGSAGKTTTKDLLGDMLAAAGPTVRTRHNDNGLLGVPASLLAIRPSDRFAVIELGIKDGPGEMRWMAGLFRPQVAVLTGVGDFHTEVFGSREAIAREKRELLLRLGARGVAVVNADDHLARAATVGLPCRVVLAGTAADADVRLLSVRSAWPHGLDVELAIGARRLRARVGVHGRHLAPLVALAVAAADAAGVPPERALDAAGTFAPRVGRLSPAPGPRGSMLIVDDWKSRVPTAVAAVQALGETGARRRIAVLGEIQERASYQPIARALADCADQVIAVGGAGEPLAALLAGSPLAAGLRCVPDSDAAAVSIRSELAPGAVALLHGTGNHDLERIQLLLDDHTDPDWLRDWRLRPALRVPRPVAEVTARVDATDGAALLDAPVGDLLTYLGIAGHRVDAEGRLVPAEDAALLAWAADRGVAALLVVDARDVGDDDRACRRFAEQALRHAGSGGYRGVTLDGSTGGLGERMLELVAGRLRAAGLWLTVVLPPDAEGGAGAADMVELAPALVVDEAALAGVPPRKLLLGVAATGADEVTAALAVIRERGLRGLAVSAPFPVEPAARLIEHAFQLRKRAPWA